MSSEAPDATIVVVTRDRRGSLGDTLASALAQRGAIEVLVIDDGSTDATTEHVTRAFPDVRVVRHETSAGLVVRRNEAARLARGRVIVSIDDDAVFTAADTVERALAEIDVPRIAAVGLPYVDVRRSAHVHQRARDDRCWIGPVFRGTAHAIRRDVFLELGGYRERIVHQGEEHDLCLRLLDAGWLVRYGTGTPIHHVESPRRSRRRMERYGRRNEILLCVTLYPRRHVVPYAVGYAAKSVLRGLRQDGGLVWIVEGIARGVVDGWRLRGERAPVRDATFALDRRLRRAGALPLEEIEP